MALAVPAAGCGGGDSASSDAAGETTATARESDANLDAVKRFVAQAEAAPTKIPVKVPLKAKPKAGQTIVNLSFDIPQAQQVAQGVRQAVEAVGWKYEQINFKSADISTLVAALQEALQRKPLAVVFAVGPEPTWQQLRPAYEKAGVGMIPYLIGPAKETGPVWANIGSGAQNEWIGKVLADWMIVDSGGTGKAVLQAIPAFGAVTEWVDAFKREVAEQCPKCGVKTAETSIADATGGTAGSSLISALQSNGSKYAFVYNGAFIPGLKGQLDAAGLSDVKLGGWSATSEYITNELKGSDYAWLAPNTRYIGWLAVDTALRHLEGTKLPTEQTLLPARLITKDNATPQLVKAVDDFRFPTDYGQQFQALWQVGG
ncbi:MAG: substrate-binding domain-containing protein [Aeromicrobium sp.]